MWYSMWYSEDCIFPEQGRRTARTKVSHMDGWAHMTRARVAHQIHYHGVYNSFPCQRNLLLRSGVFIRGHHDFVAGRVAAVQ